MTILVVGSDSGSLTAVAPRTRGTADSPASDAVMLVHIDAGGQAVSVISIPRNSWVSVPGIGMMSLYHVLALGGPPLLIRTVEHLTEVRIDHYMVINFAGLRDVIKMLGGVPVEIAASTKRDGIEFHKGINILGPRAAWVYVTTASRRAGCHCWQRGSLPGGDLSRVQRQQNLIRAILAKIAEKQLFTTPLTAYRVILSLDRAVSVDSTFTSSQLVSLTLKLARLRDADLTFLAAPVRGLGFRHHDGVVYLDQAGCASLWNAVRHDSVAAWAVRHPSALTPKMPY